MPGGGMFNCALSLGNAGTDVQLITELGDDYVGRIIMQTLERGGVKHDYLRVSHHNSSLALAFLDDSGNADYQFYKEYPAAAPEFTVPDFTNHDILIFGSLYSVDSRNRGNIVKLAISARNAGAVIIYDPNFRKSNAGKLPELLPSIVENISLADIVRGSDEDFKLIMNASDSNHAYEFVRDAGGKHLIVTQNREGADLFTEDNHRAHFDAIPVKIVSTIGAGDAFNAGIAYQIHQLGRVPSTPDEWKSSITTGLSYAAEVCSRQRQANQD